MNIIDIAQRAAVVIKTEVPTVQGIYLYGSQASGQQKPEGSDIDILAVVSTQVAVNWSSNALKIRDSLTKDGITFGDGPNEVNVLPLETSVFQNTGYPDTVVQSIQKNPKIKLL